MKVFFGGGGRGEELLACGDVGLVMRPELVFPVSQNHRLTEWSGLEGTSVGHPVQPPAEAGSPRAGCTAPRPGGS